MDEPRPPRVIKDLTLYSIGVDGQPSFTCRSYTCPFCGRTSHNPNDVRNRYCGACHCWSDEIQEFRNS